ncbi:anthranilate phosphoribosyltransferase [Phytophthora pseudosyringae]|uniref:anthranilate phosphoribosyltransferase n=1 Tax=Phytophthora pseudosyringae TaxID=221518 RepID=A0A8T1VHZ7_9STRA|nr:anthranilate phosphoribosyltransferase [Phytophthora pseudosyringae]
MPHGEKRQAAQSRGKNNQTGVKIKKKDATQTSIPFPKVVMLVHVELSLLLDPKDACSLLLSCTRSLRQCVRDAIATEARRDGTGAVLAEAASWVSSPGSPRLGSSAGFSSHQPLVKHVTAHFAQPDNRAMTTMELSALLAKLTRREDLTDAEATFAVQHIASEKAAENPVGVGVLLALLAAKGESAAEVAAFAKHMRSEAVAVHVSSGRPTLDIVGTGGDGAHTVNLSTAAAVLAASCGALVAKHGNRSVSSRSGSADVLEELGVPMLKPEQVAPCLEEAQIAFMFAPNFHPAMRHVAPVRKAIGVRSVFNILGPLLNPTGCKRMVIGVYTPDLLDVFGEVLLALGVEHGLVVHCAGLDELNSIGPADVVEVRQGAEQPLRRYELRPEDVGVPAVTLEQLKGGDAAENAAILRKVFSGAVHSEGPVGDTIAYNAGAGLYVYGLADSIKSGYEMAKKQLSSGKALATLDKWAQVAQQLHAQPQL